MKHFPLLIAFLLMLHSASGAEPKTLEEALVSFQWSWNNPSRPKWKSITFTQDGIATVAQDGGPPNVAKWEKTGALIVTMEEFGERKLQTVLAFDPTLKSYTATKTWDAKEKISGQRLNPQMAASMPSQPVFATIQTDANQPRIEVIKDQGPNATEWALTPLEEAIPSDIRQNLTYLREDLLDEAKKSPKAATDAYALASDYCDKILSALDQRDLARVNAGYSAAQADANVRVTSQALESRRNYKMSWPQYAREQSQRAEIYRQQSAGADVRKEQIKVNWANRSVQMRAYLDDLYTKLRAALR